jgi:hypothetical protein
MTHYRFVSGTLLGPKVPSFSIRTIIPAAVTHRLALGSSMNLLPDACHRGFGSHHNGNDGDADQR